MGAITSLKSHECCLEAPERNRYFHGKMLTDRDFRLETDYHNGKRWLINRLVIGWGVVCGLDVKIAEGDDHQVIVEPGVAIDRWGREIIVDCRTAPIPVPPELVGEPGKPDNGPYEPAPEPGNGYGDEPDEGGKGDYGKPPNGGAKENGHTAELHLVLCYHECASEPTPVLAGDCRDEEPCQPGVIRERYKLEFRPGCLPPRRPRLVIPDVISSDGRVDYEALARAVSEPCPCPEDPCIPLANLHIQVGGEREDCLRDVDISVRPIVYGNDLLFQLILSAVAEEPSYRRDK